MITRVAPPRPSGAGLQAARLSRRLSDLGWNVTILTTSPTSILPRRREIDGVATVEWPVRQWTRRLEKLLFLTAVAVHLVRHPRRYAVVHLHGAFYVLRLLRLMKPLLPFRLVYKPTMRRMDDALVIRETRGKSVVEAVDAWACVSRSLAAAVADAGARGRVLQVPNGVECGQFRAATDAERMAARKTLGLPQERRLWLSVSVIVARKRLDLLVQAWALLPEPRPLLLFVGATGAETSDDRVYGERLGSLIRELGLSASVRVVGMRTDVELFFRAADGFVFASRQEGLPTALLEALASGLPVISTEFEGVSDIEALSTGRLEVTRDEPRAIAHAISTCELEPGLVPEGLSAVEFGHVAEQYSRLYGELVAGGPG